MSDQARILPYSVFNLILTDVVISSAISTSRAIKEWNLLTTEYSRRNVSMGQVMKYFTSVWFLEGVGYLGDR